MRPEAQAFAADLLPPSLHLGALSDEIIEDLFSTDPAIVLANTLFAFPGSRAPDRHKCRFYKVRN
jgi:hypothetical protein